MSIKLRRNSLRKSSIGIDSIRASITNLSEGLVSIGKQSSELLKETRKSNLLKSKLISQDAEFFKKRRENVLRKQREDELEASTITGATKRQGNVIQKSTRGFLGRIIDYLATLIIGWSLLNLPLIINAFKTLFGIIDKVVGVFTGFIGGMRSFFDGVGAGVDSFLSSFNRFNFLEDDKNIKETFEKTENSLVKLNQDFTESVNSFINDEDLQSAEKVAEDLEITDPSEVIAEDAFTVPFELENESDDDDTPDNEIEGIQTETNLDELDTERRNLGGPVESDQPVIVGDAAGIDSRSAELFVPNVDGRIVSNNELEDIVMNNEKLNEIDDLITSTEDDSDPTRSLSLPPLSSPSKINLQKDDSSEIKGVKTSRRDTAIMPISKRKELNFKSPKKVRRVVMINNQKNMNVQQPSMPSNKTMIVRTKQSNQKILEKIHSILLY